MSISGIPSSDSNPVQPPAAESTEKPQTRIPERWATADSLRGATQFGKDAYTNARDHGLMENPSKEGLQADERALQQARDLNALSAHDAERAQAWINMALLRVLPAEDGFNLIKSLLNSSRGVGGHQDDG